MGQPAAGAERRRGEERALRVVAGRLELLGALVEDLRDPLGVRRVLHRHPAVALDEDEQHVLAGQPGQQRLRVGGGPLGVRVWSISSANSRRSARSARTSWTSSTVSDAALVEATGAPLTAWTPVAKARTHGGHERRRRGQREPAMTRGHLDQPQHGERYADQERQGGQAGQHGDRPGPSPHRSSRRARRPRGRGRPSRPPGRSRRSKTVLNDRSRTFTSSSSASEHAGRHRERGPHPAPRHQGRGRPRPAPRAGSRSSAARVRWSRSVGATSASQTTRKASDRAVGHDERCARGARQRSTRLVQERLGEQHRTAATATVATQVGQRQHAPRRRARRPTRAATVLHQNRGRRRRRRSGPPAVNTDET